MDGKWIAPLELLAGCAAAGDEALEWAGDEALEWAGDEALELAQPAVTTATAETTAIARPVSAHRGRGRAGPPPGGCFSDGVSAAPPRAESDPASLPPPENQTGTAWQAGDLGSGAQQYPAPGGALHRNLERPAPT